MPALTSLQGVCPVIGNGKDRFGVAQRAEQPNGFRSCAAVQETAVIVNRPPSTPHRLFLGLGQRIHHDNGRTQVTFGCCQVARGNFASTPKLTIKSWSSSGRTRFGGSVYPANRADTDFRLEPNIQLRDLQLHSSRRRTFNRSGSSRRLRIDQ